MVGVSEMTVVNWKKGKTKPKKKNLKRLKAVLRNSKHLFPNLTDLNRQLADYKGISWFDYNPLIFKEI
jgi:hypothetical protein